VAWGRLDDQMSDHPKIQAAGNAAVGAWARMLSWSGRYATDGLVPSGVARGYATRAELARLRAAGPSGAPMLHGPGDECRCLVTGPAVPAGWYALHDFDQYNERGYELRLRRARKAELRDPALRLAVRDRDRDHCRYCGTLCTLTGPRRLVLDHVEPGRTSWSRATRATRPRGTAPRPRLACNCCRPVSGDCRTPVPPWTVARARVGTVRG
jgi:hypothetical protein